MSQFEREDAFSTSRFRGIRLKPYAVVCSPGFINCKQLLKGEKKSKWSAHALRGMAFQWREPRLQEGANRKQNYLYSAGFRLNGTVQWLPLRGKKKKMVMKN